MFKTGLTACFVAVLHGADVSHAGCLKSSLYVVSDGLQSDREACPYCAQYAVTLAQYMHITYAHHNMHHTLTGTYAHHLGTHGRTISGISLIFDINMYKVIHSLKCV